MNGSMLIMEADDFESVNAYLENDPYKQANLFQSVEVRPWLMAIGELVPKTYMVHHTKPPRSNASAEAEAEAARFRAVCDAPFGC
jgi:hypothetical protein